jgi:prepilin peptidase CpaA
VSVLTCLLAGIRWWLTGDLGGFVASVALAAVCFAGMTVLFLRGLVGGGDVKLLAASLLLIGSAHALPFLLLMTVLGGVVALGVLLVRRLRSSTSEHPATVPYGVAIATSAFWTLISDRAVMSM